MKECYCGKPIRARELCHNHYEQWRKKNPLTPKNPTSKWIEQGERLPCMYPECEKPIRAQGLCQKHINQFYYAVRKESK